MPTRTRETQDQEDYFTFIFPYKIKDVLCILANSLLFLICCCLFVLRGVSFCCPSWSWMPRLKWPTNLSLFKLLGREVQATASSSPPLPSPGLPLILESPATWTGSVPASFYILSSYQTTLVKHITKACTEPLLNAWKYLPEISMRPKANHSLGPVNSDHISLRCSVSCCCFCLLHSALSLLHHRLQSCSSFKVHPLLTWSQRKVSLLWFMAYNLIFLEALTLLFSIVLICSKASQNCHSLISLSQATCWLLAGGSLTVYLVHCRSSIFREWILSVLRSACTEYISPVIFLLNLKGENLQRDSVQRSDGEARSVWPLCP